MSASRQVSAVIFVGLLFALACRDAVRPIDPVGTFVLERVDSDMLPAVYFADDYLRVRVLADTLFLHADGRGVRSALVDYEVVQGGDGTRNEVPVVNEFTHERTGTRLEIAFTCGVGAACSEPPHFVARLMGGTIAVEYAMGGRVPMYYRLAESAD